MHLPIALNQQYFVFGMQASDILDMSQFHKIVITKCNHRESQKQS